MDVKSKIVDHSESVYFKPLNIAVPKPQNPYMESNLEQGLEWERGYREWRQGCQPHAKRLFAYKSGWRARQEFERAIAHYSREVA